MTIASELLLVVQDQAGCGIFSLRVEGRAHTLGTDERVKTQLLEMERQWRHVAKSYEFIESLERFLLDQQKNALPQAEESPSRDNLDAESELSEPLRSAQ